MTDLDMHVDVLTSQAEGEMELDLPQASTTEVDSIMFDVDEVVIENADDPQDIVFTPASTAEQISTENGTSDHLPPALPTDDAIALHEGDTETFVELQTAEKGAVPVEDNSSGQSTSITLLEGEQENPPNDPGHSHAESPIQPENVAAEEDELEALSREPTPELEEQPDPYKPTLQLDLLGNVVMRSARESSASSSGSSDTSIQAPPLKLSYLNETFWLFAEDRSEQKTPVASTSTTHHLTGVYPVLLNQPQDHTLYYSSLDALFNRLHEDFPSFTNDEMEMVLCMPEDYGIEISEDNVYAREISLFDLNRIHVGCNRDGRLHLTLDARTRAVCRFNTLAMHVAKHTGLLPPDEFDIQDEEVDDETASHSDEAELYEEIRDESDAGNETEATAVDGLPEEQVKDSGAQDLDELDENEAIAPEQYEDAIDESGLVEAHIANGTESDPENAEDESSIQDDAKENGQSPDPEGQADETDNIDELQESPALIQAATADLTTHENDSPGIVFSERSAVNSPKRGREEDPLDNHDAANEQEGVLPPEPKRARAT